MQRKIIKPGIVPQSKEVTMKTVRSRMSQAAVMIALAAILAPQAVMALTAPCTTISNQASLDYEVGGVNQTDVLSDDPLVTPGDPDDVNKTEFYVGIKILLDVTNQDAGNVSVTPSTTVGSELEFLVTNTGNAIHDYLLTPLNEATDDGSIDSPHAGVDEFSPLAANVKLFLESGAEVGLQTSGANADTDLSLAAPANTIQDLSPTTDYTAQWGGVGARRVYVYYLPSELVAEDTQVGVYYLKATTLWADGSALVAALTDDGNNTMNVTNAMAGVGVCGAGQTVDVVLGDELDDNTTSIADNGLTDIARNGAAIDDSAFIVATANLVVTKAKAIYSDPVNGAPGKAIPGAVVTYTISVENTGTADATNVIVTDDLTAEIADLDFGNLDTTVAYGSIDGGYFDGFTDCAANNGIVVTDGTPAAPATCKTDADDAEAGADAKFAANVVTVTGLTVEASETAVVKFQVTIK